MASVGLGAVYVSLELRLQKMRADIAAAKREMRGFEASLQRTADFTARLGRNMTLGLSAPLALLAKQSLDTAVSFDSLKRSLAAVMGSSEAARKEFVKLEQAAKLPGVGFEEAIQGSVNLQSAGYSADFARRAIIQFGNALAISGRGKADLDAVLYNLTQIKSMGKLTGDELRETASRIPQFGKILREAFGTGDTAKIIKSGIGIDEILEAVIQGFERLPRAADSAQNKMDNFSDSVKKMKAAIGDALLPSVSRWMKTLEGQIVKVTDAFKGMSPATQDAFAGLTAGGILGGGVLIFLSSVIRSLATIKTALAAIAGTAAFKFLAGLAGTTAGGGAIAMGGSYVLNFLPKTRTNQVPSAAGRGFSMDRPEQMPGWATGTTADQMFSNFVKNSPEAAARKQLNIDKMLANKEAEKERRERAARIKRDNESLKAEIDGEIAQIRLEAKRQLEEELSPALVNQRMLQKISDVIKEGHERKKALREKEAREEKAHAEKLNRLYQEQAQKRADLEDRAYEAALGKSAAKRRSLQDQFKKDFLLDPISAKQVFDAGIEELAKAEADALLEAEKKAFDDFMKRRNAGVAWTEWFKSLANAMRASIASDKFNQMAIDEAARVYGLDDESATPGLRSEAMKEQVHQQLFGGHGGPIRGEPTFTPEDAKEAAKKAAPWTFNLGQELGNSLAFEMGRSFQDAFDKIFGTGNPLARALSRTFARLVDDIMYQLAQRALGSRLILSIFGGGGGGAAAGVGAGAFASGALYGPPAAAGAKAGGAFGAAFAAKAAIAIGAVFLAGKGINALLGGSGKFGGNLGAFASTAMPSMPSIASGLTAATYGQQAFNVNFYGANFANNIDFKKAGASIAWHAQNQMRTRPGA